MVRSLARSPFAAALCISTPSLATTPLVAQYALAPLSYEPGPLTRVGRLQAGFVCLPKKKLRWRDIARPEDDVLRRRLVEVLGRSGLSVAPPASALFGDPEPVTPYRVRVVVAAMDLRLCVAGLGIGEKKPSGAGMLTVRWETYDRAVRAKIDSVTFDVPIVVAGRDARDASSVFSDAMVEGAERYAEGRRGKSR